MKSRYKKIQCPQGSWVNTHFQIDGLRKFLDFISWITVILTAALNYNVKIWNHFFFFETGIHTESKTAWKDFKLRAWLDQFYFAIVETFVTDVKVSEKFIWNQAAILMHYPIFDQWLALDWTNMDYRQEFLKNFNFLLFNFIPKRIFAVRGLQLFIKRI